MNTARPSYSSYTSELMLREYIREQLHEGEQVVITEGSITRAVANNAVQWLVAGAAEYGLGGVTMPAAGAGVAVGPAAETAVDAAFGAEKVLSTVKAAANIYSEMGEFAGTFKEAIAAYSGGDLSGYYDQLVALTKSAVKIIGKKAGDALEKVAKKITDLLQKIVSKIVGALNAGLKIIIPDATIGAGVATAIEAAVMKLAENSYSLLDAATQKFKMFKDFLADPSVAVDFFKDLLGGVADLMREFGEKIKDQGKGILGKAKAVAKYGPVGGMLIPQFGPTGFQKLGELIDTLIPTVVAVANGVLKVLMPALITAVGFIQILVTGAWKEDEEGEGDGREPDSDDGVIDFDGDGRADEARKISRNEIRNIISEVLHERENYLNIP